MNGVDAITFTAGVGENAAWLRPMVCKYLGFLGVELDEAASEKLAVLKASSLHQNQRLSFA